jgi:DNA polymerase-1
MSKNKVLVIDGNNMLYRAYYKFENLQNNHGQLTGVIYGFPYILRGLISLHKPQKVVVVFDGGRDKRRTEILPEYKKRDKKAGFDGESFFFQKEKVKELLDLLGIPMIEVKKREADDIIWLIARKLKREKHEVVIVSSDKDFNQLICKGISIWNPKSDKRYTHLNLKQEVGYNANQCVDYLILDGDSSDNIKGMPGIGPKKAMAFLDRGISIRNYLISKDKELPGLSRNKLEPVFLLNRELIDIRIFCRRNLKHLKVKVPKVTLKKINKKELAYFCANYDISTFVKPDFIETFNKLLK